MNRLYLKQIQIPKKKKNPQRNRNKLLEIKYGNTLRKTQIRDHPNNVPTSKDFKRSIDFSTSSKVRVFRSLQISHIKQANLTYKLKLMMVIIRRKT